jgi:hypothetical protein
VISGPAGSGRTNTLAAFASSLLGADDPPVTHLLSYRRQHTLADQGLWTSVGLGEEARRELLAQLASTARESPSGTQPTVLFIDDGEELFAGMGLPDLDWLARDGTEHGFRVVVAVDSQKELTWKGWVTQVARARHRLVFDPGFGADATIVGQPAVKLPQSRTPLPGGAATSSGLAGTRSSRLRRSCTAEARAIHRCRRSTLYSQAIKSTTPVLLQVLQAFILG